MKDCECYRVKHEIRYSEDGIGKTISVECCAGTKEMDACGCHGNKLCCDFYPEKRRVERTEKTIQLYPGTSAEPVTITIRVPNDRDAEEYIDEYLDGLLSDCVRYNCEWEFA